VKPKLRALIGKEQGNGIVCTEIGRVFHGIKGSMAGSGL